MTEPFERKATDRRRPRGRSSLPSMSERQLQAYLLARDAVRRIQRASALFGDANAQLPGRQASRLPSA
jgi:hypothetical protein